MEKKKDVKKNDKKATHKNDNWEKLIFNLISKVNLNFLMICHVKSQSTYPGHSGNNFI